MKWIKEPIYVEDVRTIHERYKVDLLSASLFARRQITHFDQIEFYLERDLVYLHNPFLFDEMEMFVDRILSAKEEGETLCIFGDRDIDGISSTVLLINELKALGIETLWHLPEGDAPYGLTKEGIDFAHRRGATCLVTVDCGISNHEEVTYARSLGLDVLITDHHLAGEIIPGAEAIINPKLSGCGYPFADLAGCGVVAKCIWALRFAQTEFYKEELLFLHALPGNETIIIEALLLKNLQIEQRITEEIVPGVLALEQSRLVQFLDRQLPILVFDEETEQLLLHEAFGSATQFNLTDIRPLLATTLEQIGDKSLFNLKQMSRTLRYKRQASELDLLIALFTAYIYRKHPQLSTEYEKILDLVAIGTIADLMPMVNENRIMVRLGLEQLGLAEREQLRPLLLAQNLIARKITTTDVGWHISPILNAAGRLGQPQLALQLFLSHDADEIEKLTQQLLHLNRERQRQGELHWERLAHQAQQSHAHYEGKFLMVEDSTIRRGMTGALASRFLRAYNVPTLVVAQLEDEPIYTGSMRSPNNFNSRSFLSQFSDLFITFGGHACAGGFRIAQENYLLLKERFGKVLAEMDERDEEEEVVRIDVELPPEYLNPNLINLVETFEPYGEQNPPLHFFISDAYVEDIQYLNSSRSNEDGHLKLQIAYGNYRWPALYWNASSKVNTEFSKGDYIDLVFRLGRNYYRNNETLQLTVVALRRHGKNIEEIMNHRSES